MGGKSAYKPPTKPLSEARTRMRKLLAARQLADDARIETAVRRNSMTPASTPEEDDARALMEVLPPEVAQKLAAAVRDLPGDSGQLAKINRLMNVHMRHQAIVRLKAQGMHPERIARAVGVSRLTVDQVCNNYFKRRQVELESENFDQFIMIMAEGYLEDIDRLTDVIQSSRHSQSVVGAINARQMARQKYIDLLADFGFLKRAPKEQIIQHEGLPGQGDVYNQYVVVDPDTVRELTRNMLRAKRQMNGLPQNPEDEDRLASLVVQDEKVPEPSQVPRDRLLDWQQEQDSE